jgi:hypothetical protein
MVNLCICHDEATDKVSEDEWDDRNLLYSLRYDLGTTILISGCNLRQV